MRWSLMIPLLVMASVARAQEQSIFVTQQDALHAEATQSIAVGQLGTAKLSWRWVPGPDGGEPTKVYTRCARAGEPRNLEKVLDVPPGVLAMSILAKDVVGKQGTYDCTFQAWNETGFGEVSAPFPFVLRGGLPPPIIDIKLE